MRKESHTIETVIPRNEQHASKREEAMSSPDASPNALDYEIAGIQNSMIT